MTFGTFISTRRKALKLNLRDTAKHLKIAYGYAVQTVMTQCELWTDNIMDA